MEAIGFPKRRFVQEPHGITSQKMGFFIVVYSSISLHVLIEVRLHFVICNMRIKLAPWMNYLHLDGMQGIYYKNLQVRNLRLGV
jgi:hypothetical protein